MSTGGRDQVEYEGADHGEVVAPGQVEDPGVVLLPVGEQEAEVDVPVQAEHAEHRDREAIIVPPKDRVDCARDEDSCPGVQPRKYG